MIRGALLLAGLFLIGGTAAAQEQLLDVPYTRFVLPNGLNVILHRILPAHGEREPLVQRGLRP
jgi:hypothetical protein